MENKGFYVFEPFVMSNLLLQAEAPGTKPVLPADLLDYMPPEKVISWLSNECVSRKRYYFSNKRDNSRVILLGQGLGRLAEISSLFQDNAVNSWLGLLK